jgi:hypothetical protein
MSTIRSLHTLTLTVTLMLSALLASAPLALAQRIPDPPPYTGAVAPPASTPAPAVSHGSPVWVFIVVTAVTAAVSITATWLVSTRAHQRRRLSASPA